MKTFYEILGVSRDAGQDEIKKAYRKLAFENHPDLNRSQQSDEKMALVNEAYSVLSDETKRLEYDLWLKNIEDCYSKFNQKENSDNHNINFIIVSPQKYFEAVNYLVAYLAFFPEYKIGILTIEDYTRNEVKPSDDCYVLFVGHPDENIFVEDLFPKLNFRFTSQVGIYYIFQKERGVIFGDGDVGKYKDLIRLSKSVREGFLYSASKKTSLFPVYFLGGLALLNPVTSVAMVASGVAFFAGKNLFGGKMRQEQIRVGFEIFVTELNKRKAGV